MGNPQGHNQPRKQESPEYSDAKFDQQIEKVLETGDSLAALGKTIDIVGQTPQRDFDNVDQFFKEDLIPNLSNQNDNQTLNA